MEFQQIYYPLIVMAVGIALVITMIMYFRLNAFLALITAAMVVSLLALDKNEAGQFVGVADNAVGRVATAFGGACESIAIVIAMAAVIGACMMESGAADRIVRAFMRLLGEKRAPWALMGSGYVLAIPVFFDTVFYLLVPLARSFYRRTGGSYLKCLLAISAGGAITHTLVPPTPGPLTMAANLGIDLGKMILVGLAVAAPAAVAGILFAGFADRWLNIPMREIEGQQESDPLEDHELPGLFISLVPVLLPVVLIAAHTVTSTLSDAALLSQSQQRLSESGVTVDQEIERLTREDPTLGRSAALQAIRAETLASWDTPDVATRVKRVTTILGDPDLALLLSAAVALVVYLRQRRPNSFVMSRLVEGSLMSAGLIILITAGGSAFGGMLKVAGVGDAIRLLFVGSQAPGMLLLLLGFGIAALLKFAQGSSTAAMIITSQMLAGMIVGLELPFDRVYLATAIGAGTGVGSWMNDSGYWIFAKMGGLTEREGLVTWTPLLAILGIVSMIVTVLLATFFPLV